MRERTCRRWSGGVAWGLVGSWGHAVVLLPWTGDLWRGSALLMAGFSGQWHFDLSVCLMATKKAGHPSCHPVAFFLGSLLQKKRFFQDVSCFFLSSLPYSLTPGVTPMKSHSLSVSYASFYIRSAHRMASGTWFLFSKQLSHKCIKSGLDV